MVGSGDRLSVAVGCYLRWLICEYAGTVRVEAKAKGKWMERRERREVGEERGGRGEESGRRGRKVWRAG